MVMPIFLRKVAARRNRPDRMFGALGQAFILLVASVTFSLSSAKRSVAVPSFHEQVAQQIFCDPNTVILVPLVPVSWLCLQQLPVRPRGGSSVKCQQRTQASSSNSAFASLRSGVSKPSVNQP